MTPARSIVEEPASASPARITGWWIWDRPEPPPGGMATCFFRRRLDRRALGENPILHLSADARYRAWLNGRLISRGPCRGTSRHYHYESIALAPWLKQLSEASETEQIVLAVEVRWYGNYAPIAEVHVRPGLWVNLCDAKGNALLVSDENWHVQRSTAHTTEPLPSRQLPFYTVVDPCEDIDLARWPHGWLTPGFDDSGWKPAVKIEEAYGKYEPTAQSVYTRELIPRTIPVLEEMPVFPARLVERGRIQLEEDPTVARQIRGPLEPAKTPAEPFWGANPKPLKLRGATEYLILDMGQIVTAYPRLSIDCPCGTMVELRYSEALSRDGRKAVRDDRTAGEVEGYFDFFRCDQDVNVIEPFVWRTFRFLRLAIHRPDPSAGPVTIRNLETIYTAYPFRPQAAFRSSEPLHQTLWDVSWRTARLCAHEHYEDCPYYEQLQYMGDTRLQALISYAVAGDFRLGRQALRQWADSRREDGMTFSRNPSAPWEQQIIPNFALVGIEALEDYYQYSGDRILVRELMETVRGVLRWFDRFDDDGLLRDVPYWIFTDWSLPADGRRMAGSQGELNIRRAGALAAASRLASAIGDRAAAAAYRQQARRCAAACRKRLWNAGAGLFCDEPDGTLLGEHATLLAILYGLVDRRAAHRLIDKLEAAPDLRRTGIYFSWYKARAYERAGCYERAYAACLPVWQGVLDLHGTTWFESAEPCRSDCHAWGSWIMADLLTTVLGIQPARPGFAAVRITPHFLPGLTHAAGHLPTPRGNVTVEWRRKKEQVRLTITLPKKVTGQLVLPGRHPQPLGPGRQALCLAL